MLFFIRSIELRMVMFVRHGLARCGNALFNNAAAQLQPSEKVKQTLEVTINDADLPALINNPMQWKMPGLERKVT